MRLKWTARLGNTTSTMSLIVFRQTKRISEKYNKRFAANWRTTKVVHTLCITLTETSNLLKKHIIGGEGEGGVAASRDEKQDRNRSFGVSLTLT